MDLANYPDLDNHKKHHRKLIQKLSEKQFWIDGKQSEKQTDDLISFLLTWFFEHTAGVDKLFADYISEKIAKVDT